MDKKHNQSSAKLQMNRRKFLSLAPAAALLPVVANAEVNGRTTTLLEDSTLNPATQTAAASMPTTNSLAVGYWPGQIPVQATPFADGLADDIIQNATQDHVDADDISKQNKLVARIQDATRIKPDTSLQGRELSVTIHHLNRATAERLNQWQLDAMFNVQTQNGREQIPFHAWIYKDDQSSEANAVSFTVPVDQNGSLVLQSARSSKPADDIVSRLLQTVFVGRRSAETRCDNAICQLSTDITNAGPKLRQGVYFIAGPGYHNDKLPNWSQYEWHTEASSETTAENTLKSETHHLYRRTLTGLAEVDFDYIVMSVTVV